MANGVEAVGRPRGNRLVTAAWMAVAVAILIAPAVAMQFTEEVDWTGFDFVFAALLLFGAGGAYEAISRLGGLAYRAGTALAIFTAFLLIWMNGAVGIIGSENNSANLMYGGVLLTGLIGAVIARFGAPGMARSLFAMAAAQAVVAVIAIVGGLGLPETGPAPLVVINGFFCMLWILAGGLYRVAALGQAFARLAP